MRNASGLVCSPMHCFLVHTCSKTVDHGPKIRVMATSIPMGDLGVETFEGSIMKGADVARAVEGIRDVYHLAGRVSRERDDSREMYALHVEGTRLLCEAAKTEGVKAIVMASTSGTIAVTADGEGVPDETYTRTGHLSRWPYYASKTYQEVAGSKLNGRACDGDYESESATWPGRRTLKFDESSSRLHGAQDQRPAGRRLELC